MSLQWYCQISEVIYGPLRVSDLRRMARTGKLSPAHLLRKGESGPWHRAGKVGGLEFSARAIEPPANFEMLATPSAPVCTEATSGPNDHSSYDNSGPTRPKRDTRPEEQSRSKIWTWLFLAGGILVIVALASGFVGWRVLNFNVESVESSNQLVHTNRETLGRQVLHEHVRTKPLSVTPHPFRFGGRDYWTFSTTLQLERVNKNVDKNLVSDVWVWYLFTSAGNPSEKEMIDLMLGKNWEGKPGEYRMESFADKKWYRFSANSLVGTPVDQGIAAPRVTVHNTILAPDNSKHQPWDLSQQAKITFPVFAFPAEKLLRGDFSFEPESRGTVALCLCGLEGEKPVLLSRPIVLRLDATKLTKKKEQYPDSQPKLDKSRRYKLNRKFIIGQGVKFDRITDYRSGTILRDIIKLDLTKPKTRIGDLTFEKPCKLEVRLPDHTLLAENEGITARDNAGIIWRSRRATVFGEMVFPFFAIE